MYCCFKEDWNSFMLYFDFFYLIYIFCKLGKVKEDVSVYWSNVDFFIEQLIFLFLRIEKNRSDY